MTGSASVEVVVSYLEAAGFKRHSGSFELASIPFEFPAILVSGETDSDLVVVADTVMETGLVIQKKIERIARALDVMGSKRSITAVVTGPKPQTKVLDEIARVCRVLPIGEQVELDGDKSIRNWLRVLTPISIELFSSQTHDPISNLLNQFKDDHSGILNQILESSVEGIEEVHEVIRFCLTETLAGIVEEE